VLRFHLDESFPLAVADGLIRRGFDVTTSNQAGLLGATDDEQLAFALREMRVLLTRDRDFLRLNALGREHAGILFARSDQRRHGEIIGAISLIAGNYASDELRGRVLFI
jgi:predicted nuclease of predicted toxin-antitoxin system